MNSRGFTLIELLVVVSVIIALSAVLINVIDPAATQGKARDGVRVNNVKNLSEAIESYRQVEGSYPANTDPQDANSLLRTTYIRDWPAAVANDGSIDATNWSYRYALAGQGFILYSPNAQGGCYKYQTDWRNIMTCPVTECSITLVSPASSCI